MGATTTNRMTARAARARETRARIIAAAVELFSDNNYDEVGAADIARAAGVAHGLPFHYFGSKRGLYLEAMHTAAEQLDEAFSFDPNLPPPQQIRDAFASHLDYLATHRGLALRLVLGGRGADPQAWEVFEAARWRAVEATAELLGLDSQRPSVRMAGRAIVSAMDEAAIYWLQNGQPFDRDSLVEWMIEIASAGLDAGAKLDAASRANH
jgi:AcrR family transcriptional regulator